MTIAINQISLNPSAIARILGAVAFFLLLASIGGQFAKYVLGHDTVYGLVNLFDINREHNIPTFFAALLMLFAALLLAVISLLSREQRASHVLKWTVLSFGFVFMAFDELFQVHERFTGPVRALLGNGNLGVFYFAWVIPGIALVLGLALFFRKFLLDLTAKTSRRFTMAATIYIAGIIGVELIGGRYAELHSVQNLTYNMIVSIEEGLEMAGLIIFIWALLRHCADYYKEVRFRFDA